MMGHRQVEQVCFMSSLSKSTFPLIIFYGPSTDSSSLAS